MCRLGNESFFSAPQLKRDPLGSAEVTPRCVRRVLIHSMTNSRLGAAAVICLVIACSSDRLFAPRLVTMEGATVRAEASLWRDFQPSSPPDGRPLVAILRIQTADGSAIPSALSADSAWVYNGDAVWATTVLEEQPRSVSYFEVVARNGPKWGPGIEVDVVVRLRDSAGRSMLLQAPRQFIFRSD